MNYMEKKILIVPDVHGRKFWEVVKEYNDVPIVFLGDYLDPYTSIEGITHAQALSNFKDQKPNGLELALYGRQITARGEDDGRNPGKSPNPVPLSHIGEGAG